MGTHSSRAGTILTDGNLIPDPTQKIKFPIGYSTKYQVPGDALTDKRENKYMKSMTENNMAVKVDQTANKYMKSMKVNSKSNPIPFQDPTEKNKFRAGIGIVDLVMSRHI